MMMTGFGNSREKSRPVVFEISNGSRIRLDDDVLVQADATLAGKTLSVSGASLSADGRFVVGLLIVSYEPIGNGGLASFSAGTVIVNTSTGDAIVTELSDYQRFFYENCRFVPVIAPVISDNGGFVVYQQAP